MNEKDEGKITWNGRNETVNESRDQRKKMNIEERRMKNFNEKELNFKCKDYQIRKM